jgi:GT2 family glycosyltransferase
MPDQLPPAGPAPLISVVTVVRNARATIGETIASVRDQSFADREHIIIDGASTDGTLDVVRANGAALAAWSSEPDAGIADAMNKGLARARGRYVLFLHADDYLPDPDALARAAPALASGADIYPFDILFETAAGRARRRPRGRSWRLLFKTQFFHQGALCRRDLFERVGGFDRRYTIAMDYEFFLRAVRRGASVERVPEVLAVMRDTGISSRRDWPTLSRRFAEERAIHRQHCPQPTMALMYRAYWALYWPYRRARSRLAG